MPRPRAWGDTMYNLALVGANESRTNLLTDLSPVETKTVVRLIGSLKFVPAVDVTAGITVTRYSVGIQVVSEEAFNAGVVPNPENQEEYPARGWLYRGVTAEYLDMANNIIDTWSMGELRFDVRAARLVDRGILVCSIIQTASVGVLHNTQVVGIVRALCLV